MINGYGSIYGLSGYAFHTRQFFHALNDLTPICLCPMYPEIGKHTVSEEIKKLIHRQEKVRVSDPSICIHYGNHFHFVPGSFRIGYSVFEHTELPADWINGMRQMARLWTTSQWGKNILMAHGFSDDTIDIVPEGIDPSRYYPQTNPEKNNDVFTFISVGKWETRKGQELLLRAWSEVFHGKKDVCLLAVWNNNSLTNFSLQPKLEKLRTLGIAPIQALPQSTHPGYIAELCNLADCFVLPTRAEGWGLPIMEAMACGIPAITTNYSAITEYTTEENSYLIRVKDLVPVDATGTTSSGTWAEVDYEHLKALLWHAYTHREEVKEKGYRAHRDVHSKWSWRHAAEKAYAHLQRYGILSEVPPHAQHGSVSA